MDKDKEIIEALKRGDPECIDELYRKLFHIARGITADPDLSNDMVQEVFTVLIENLDRINITTSLEGYLVTILYRRISRYRQTSHSNSMSDIENLDLPSTQDNQEKEIIEKDRNMKLINIINELPKIYKEVLLAEIFHDDLTEEEMAERLGINLEAYKKRKQRARGKLKQKLMFKRIADWFKHSILSAL